MFDVECRENPPCIGELENLGRLSDHSGARYPAVGPPVSSRIMRRGLLNLTSQIYQIITYTIPLEIQHSLSSSTKSQSQISIQNGPPKAPLKNESPIPRRLQQTLFPSGNITAKTNLRTRPPNKSRRSIILPVSLSSPLLKSTTRSQNTAQTQSSPRAKWLLILPNFRISAAMNSPGPSSPYVP